MSEAKGWNAIVVGGMNLDIQGRAAEVGLSLSAEVGLSLSAEVGLSLSADSYPGRVTESAGGVGRNIAENLKRLGLEVSLLTVIAGDSRAGRLAEETRALGIDLSLSLLLEAGRCPTYLCLLDSEGRLVAAVSDMEAIDSLMPLQLEQRFAALDKADLLVVEANLPAPSVEALARRYGPGGELELQGKKRPLLAYDPVSVAKAGRAQAVLSRFDLIKPNRAEAALLAGFEAGPGGAARPGSGRGGLSALADSWRAATASENGACYISLGAEGLFVEGQLERAGRFRAIVRSPEIPLVNV